MITMSLREVVSLLIFALLLFVVYGLEMLLLVDYARDRIRGQSRRSALFHKRYLALHAAAVLGLGGMLYGYLIEPTWIDVPVMTLRSPKLQDTGFRLVQISDLHCDRKIRNEESMVRLINDLKPDIIVATGDFLNHSLGLPHLRDSLQRLNASLGKFAVMGNQDVRWLSRLDLLESTGFRWLNGETVVVTKNADRIGIHGMPFAGSDAPSGVVGPLARERFNVLLFHTPDLIEDIGGSGVDLYLCGHTHGGQVTLPWYGALITFSKFGKKYESGLYRVGETTLYVNRGLGLEPRPGPQVRFLARPEIAVFDILPEQR
ncbi:MAG: hypothetical protein FJ280_02580 [Planctomycetes bacterium]|nr:hypothetical protein [Planctomycetota bacterium]